MTNILYIGNNLKNSKANVTFMATLGPMLEKEGLLFGLLVIQRKQDITAF